MMNKELLQELVNYPEIEGLAKILAEGIAAVIFPECVMIFFDDDAIEPTGNFSEIENISNTNRAIVYSLSDVKRDSDKWDTLEAAREAARTGLRRKDGKKIKWH